MVNIVTKPGMLRIVKDPDGMFDDNNMLGYCKENKLAQTILKEIDGFEKFDGDFIDTKYGPTIIDNISTGSKSAILMIKDNNIAVYEYELGINVIKALNKLPGTYNIVTKGGSLKLTSSDEIQVDGVLYKGKDSINDAIARGVGKE